MSCQRSSLTLNTDFLGQGLFEVLCGHNLSKHQSSSVYLKFWKLYNIHILGLPYYFHSENVFLRYIISLLNCASFVKSLKLEENCFHLIPLWDEYQWDACLQLSQFTWTLQKFDTLFAWHLLQLSDLIRHWKRKYQM